MHIRTFVAPGFAENSYLVWQAGAAIAIDPGADASALIETLRLESLQLAAIVLTHAHIDHIEGVAALKRHADVPIYMHPADRPLYDNAALQAAQFGMQIDKLPPVERSLTHGEMLRIADVEFEVRHVPGHSPGHVLLYVADEDVAFVGDVVFQGSIGRTDLPGGSYQQLMQSIRNQVMTLPNETRLYSGHGPATTVLEERTYNPFIAPMYGGSLA